MGLTAPNIYGTNSFQLSGTDRNVQSFSYSFLINGSYTDGTYSSYIGTVFAPPVGSGYSNLLSCAAFAVSSESLDSAYQVSNLQIELIDTNGSLWPQFGNGTGALNTPFQFYAHALNVGTTNYDVGTTSAVGSVYGHVNNFGQDATRYSAVRLGSFSFGGESPFTDFVGPTLDSNPIVLHTGKITNIKRGHGTIFIESQDNLTQLNKLSWTLPFLNQTTVATQYGSFYFIPGNLGTDASSAIQTSNIGFNFGADRLSWDSYIAPLALPNGTLNSTYPADTTRGTITSGSRPGFVFLGSSFYNNNIISKFSATFLGTLKGTIKTDTDAQVYGYANLAAADAAKGDATTYNIFTTKFTLPDGTLPGTNFAFMQSNYTIAGGPSVVFKELITGAHVWPYFSGTDIDTSSFNSFATIAAFQSVTSRISPDATTVFPVIKNLLQSISCLFCVSPNNTFQTFAYGPVNLNGTLESLGSNEIIESSYENDIKFYFNRVEMDYSYNPDKNFYTQTYATSLPSWSITNDNTLLIQSQWIYSPNQVQAFVSRLLTRFKNGLPRYTLTLPISRIGMPVGSLYSVTDTDMLITNKVVQVVGYEKDPSNTRLVNATCIDASNLYSKSGYMFWGTGTSLPPGTGNTSSNAIWGSTFGGTWYLPTIGSGTANGINTAVFGTIGKWF